MNSLLLYILMLVCPKCGSSSWVEQQGPHLVQLCYCGLTKVLAFMSDGMIMKRSPAVEGKFTIPARGSLLSKVLGCLSVLGDMDSSSIANRLSITMDKATTNLSVLRSRGLVSVVGRGKHTSNGSVWQIESAVKKYYTGG